MTEGKREQLLQKINIKTHGEIEIVLLSYDVCPVCGGDLKTQFSKHDGLVRVCTVCGHEPKELVSPNKIPFGETRRKSLQSALDDGHGNTLGWKGQFCVQAHTRGVKDGPILAKHIFTITKTFTHPKLMTIRRHGYNLCRRWGLDGNNEFKDHLGYIEQKLAAHIISGNLNLSLKKVAKACFVLALNEAKRIRDFNKLLETLGITDQIVEDVGLIYASSKLGGKK